MKLVDYYMAVVAGALVGDRWGWIGFGIFGVCALLASYLEGFFTEWASDRAKE